MSKRRIESSISSLFGGRIAEELTLGAEGVTTGASNDIQRATELARNMVTKWGLSEKMGPLLYEEDEGEVFVGRSVTQRKNVSAQTAMDIDNEIRSIIDNCYNTARQLIVDNRDILDAMAAALMKYETIDAEQIDDLMARRTVRPPKGWDDSTPAGGVGVVADDVEEDDKKPSTDPVEGAT